jgi:hypothetical protein
VSVSDSSHKRPVRQAIARVWTGTKPDPLTLNLPYRHALRAILLWSGAVSTGCLSATLVGIAAGRLAGSIEWFQVVVEWVVLFFIVSGFLAFIVFIVLLFVSGLLLGSVRPIPSQGSERMRSQ